MTKKNRAVFAVVLAAGRGRRFGATKQLAEFAGKPLVRHVAATARRAFGERVLTVIGHDATAVFAALDPEAGFVVVNEDYDNGLSGSIAAAIRACPAEADAVVLMLADQPMVTAGHLQALLARWSGSDDEIVASAFAGSAGPPVLFGRSMFGELQHLQGDRGARALFEDGRFRLTTVPFEDAALDVDTRADLDALRKELLHPGDDL